MGLEMSDFFLSEIWCDKICMPGDQASLVSISKSISICYCIQIIYLPG